MLNETQKQNLEKTVKAEQIVEFLLGFPETDRINVLERIFDEKIYLKEIIPISTLIIILNALPANERIRCAFMLILNMDNIIENIDQLAAILNCLPEVHRVEFIENTLTANTISRFITTANSVIPAVVFNTLLESRCPDYLVIEGDRRYNAHNYEEARRYYKSSLAIRPNYADTLNKVDNTYLALNHYREAQEIKINNPNPNPNPNIIDAASRALNHKGSVSEALPITSPPATSVTQPIITQGMFHQPQHALSSFGQTNQIAVEKNTKPDISLKKICCVIL
ncbi:MAG: hypothetical protein A2X78_01370 [Gammaproteobacteria bacterium GWE2_37_16]|nr:MAG: hypothetical protein A2X78_01370 [Gammaproteobacteria bacterium GWE2_37_16]